MTVGAEAIHERVGEHFGAARDVWPLNRDHEDIHR
jgi:hypothetical protein